jgi:hypothetical protein
MARQRRIDPMPESREPLLHQPCHDCARLAWCFPGGDGKARCEACLDRIADRLFQGIPFPR